MRRELELRPLLVAAVCLACGIAAPAQPLWLLAALAIGIACRPFTSRAIVIVSLAFGALLSPSWTDRRLAGSGWISGEAEVLTMPELEPGASNCEIWCLGERFKLSVSGEAQMSIGDRIAFSGIVRAVDPRANPYRARHQIIGDIKATASQIEIIEPGPSVLKWAAEWRRSFVAICDRTLDERTSSLVQALCFNVRAKLSDEDMARLRRTGTVHIISTSGLHVFILAFSLQFALGLAPIPRAGQLGVLFALLAFYACAAGLDPPIVRSVLMAAVVLSAPWFERESDVPSALALAALALLLWRPVEVFELGFQLSFVAVLSLWMFAQRLQPGPKGLQYLLKCHARDCVVASAVATAATAPMIAYRYGIISIVSVLANLLIAAVVAPIIVGALLAWAISPLFEALSTGLLRVVVMPLAQWIFLVCDQLGSWPWSSIQVPDLPAAVWALPCIGALLMWRPRARQA